MTRNTKLGDRFRDAAAVIEINPYLLISSSGLCWFDKNVFWSAFDAPRNMSTNFDWNARDRIIALLLAAAMADAGDLK